MALLFIDPESIFLSAFHTFMLASDTPEKLYCKLVIWYYFLYACLKNGTYYVMPLGVNHSEPTNGHILGRHELGTCHLFC